MWYYVLCVCARAFAFVPVNFWIIRLIITRFGLNVMSLEAITITHFFPLQGDGNANQRGGGDLIWGSEMCVNEFWNNKVCGTLNMFFTNKLH
jgi:hypothetical protein